MTIDNIEEIKAELTALNGHEAATRRATPRADRRPAPARSDLAELRSSLQRADVVKLGEILARRLDGLRTSLLTQQAQGRAAEQAQAPAATATAGINARRHALSVLAQPFISYYVTLDTPFLIWEVPNPDLSIFLGSGIEAGGSW